MGTIEASLERDPSRRLGFVISFLTCFVSCLTIRAVNNVGKSHAHPVYFAESEPSEISDIIAINVDATVRITRMILPGMVKRYVLVLLVRLPSAHLILGKTD